MPCSTSDGSETMPPARSSDGTDAPTAIVSARRSRRETEAGLTPMDALLACALTSRLFRYPRSGAWP